MSNTIITPSGIARWPWLTEPNTKFNEKGTYSCDLIISEEEGKVLEKEIKKRLKVFYDQQLQSTGKSKLKLAQLPIRPFDDEEGDYDDNRWLVRAKQDAVFTNRSKTKEYKAKIVQYDSKKNVVHEKIGNGSILKLAVEPYFWYTPSLGVGCSLRLQAVQIHELKSYEGPTKTESFGFTSEQTGFVSDGEDLEFEEDQNSEDAEVLAESDF